jgi:DNA-binding NtrC family response regulator
LRLLVIEDEERLSGILKAKLGDVGFTVDVTGSAADAGAAIELVNYDAAVLDLGLPDGDGLDVLAASATSSPKLNRDADPIAPGPPDAGASRALLARELPSGSAG